MQTHIGTEAAQELLEVIGRTICKAGGVDLPDNLWGYVQVSLRLKAGVPTGLVETQVKFTTQIEERDAS